jgi:hypothetical protein
MGRLLIDDAALSLVMKKLPNSPVLAGADGGLLTPGVINVVDDPDEGPDPPWSPANEHARLIVAGAEACREIAFLAGAALERETRARALKSLTVPICSLMDVVNTMLSTLNADAARAYRDASWPDHDRATYRQVSRRLRRKRTQGPVRRVRHSLAAHLDQDAVSGRRPRLEVSELLGAMGDALVLLQLGLNYPSEHFTWIRFLGRYSSEHDVVETMQSYPATLRWIVDKSGRVQDVLPVRLASDPRHCVQEDITRGIEVYNEMAKRLDPTTPQIFLRSR